MPTLQREVFRENDELNYRRASRIDSAPIEQSGAPLRNRPAAFPGGYGRGLLPLVLLAGPDAPDHEDQCGKVRSVRCAAVLPDQRPGHSDIGPGPGLSRLRRGKDRETVSRVLDLLHHFRADRIQRSAIGLAGILT